MKFIVSHTQQSKASKASQVPKDFKVSQVLDKVPEANVLVKSELKNVKTRDGGLAWQNLATNEIYPTLLQSREEHGADNMIVSGKIHGSNGAILEDPSDGKVKYCNRIDISLNNKHKHELRKMEKDGKSEEEIETRKQEILNAKKEHWMAKGWFQTGLKHERNWVGFVPTKPNDMPLGRAMKGDMVRVLERDSETEMCDYVWKPIKEMKLGTYEICGETKNKIGKQITMNDNIHGFEGIVLVPHGLFDLSKFECFKAYFTEDHVDIDAIREFFSDHPIGKLFEGYVIKSGPNYFKIHRGHLKLGEFKKGSTTIAGKTFHMNLMDFYGKHLNEVQSLKSSCQILWEHRNQEPWKELMGDESSSGGGGGGGNEEDDPLYN